MDSTLSLLNSLTEGYSGQTYTTTISAGAAITKDLSPRGYRLCKKHSGTLVLQVAYSCSQGWNKSWVEWEDVETVHE